MKARIQTDSSQLFPCISTKRKCGLNENRITECSHSLHYENGYATNGIFHGKITDKSWKNLKCMMTYLECGKARKLSARTGKTESNSGKVSWRRMKGKFLPFSSEQRRSEHTPPRADRRRSSKPTQTFRHFSA